MALVPVAPVQEAADSLVKASTPQPFSTSRTSNWIARLGGLPDYIQHVAHGILRSDPAGGVSGAIEKAIGVVKNWASGVGKHVDANTRAAAAKAVAEWEKLKGENAAKRAGKVAESWMQEADGYRATLADELLVEQDAMARILVFEQQFGVDGMIGLLDQDRLVEAAGASWSPTMRRCASAPQEIERHEVYDGGQHVGTIAAKMSYDKSKGPQWSAFALNGQRLTDYNNASKPDALKAIQSHLEEAPARVIALPAANKFLVAQPSAYSGDTSYKQYPSEAAARVAAGLPLEPTAPERDSQVQAVAEMLRFDLMTISGLDIPPLRRVQEARRELPLAEDFHPDELRGFHGRWIASRSIDPKSTKSFARYEGGVVRASARARAAHAAKPQIKVEDLAKSVGRGKWDASAARATAVLKAQRPIDGDALIKAVREGRATDTEHLHRVRNPDGSLGAYTKERQALHDRIIENMLQGKGVHPGNAEAHFTAGGPASGKSGLEKFGMIHLPHDVVNADPDTIRAQLPEYQALMKAGRSDASSLTHEEASAVAKQLTRVALARQHHILVDTVGDSEPGKFAGKIKDAQIAGHKVSVHYATNDVPVALERAKQRTRAVPEDYLRRTHRDVSERFASEISKIPGIHLQVFDTNERPNRLIAEKLPGDDKLSIKDGERFNRFLRKAQA